MKKIKISLLGKVVIAILSGILFGQFLPGSIARIFVTFNSLFGNFLSFSIPLIILGLVAPAIGELGKGAGKLLVITALIAYGSTLFSGFFTYFSSAAIFPKILSVSPDMTAIDNPEDFMLTPYFTVGMPPLMDVMTALLLSFVLGLGISNIAGVALRDFFTDFRDIVVKLIEAVIIPLLPLHIFGIFLNMTVSGQVMSIIGMFLKVILVIFVLHILLLLIQFTIAGAVGRKNPFRLLRNMLVAYATALGTQSSAATIPVTLKQTLKNGVSENIAVFVIPLCATIHLAGSTMKIVACAMAIMIMAGEPVSINLFAGFIMMLGIVMVAAPGVPGGAIMAALGVLHSMLGFDETLQAIMIALYIAMDSFGTACNVTGDGAIAVVVDKISSKRASSSLSLYILIPLFLFSFSACKKDKTPHVTLESLLEEMVSIEESARYPEIPYRSLQVSSYDRSSVSPDSAGWFANNDGSGIVRTEMNEGRTEMVLFDEEGPGAITRIRISTSDNRGTWRFYFDGSPAANLELPAYDLSTFEMENLGRGLLQPNTLYLPIPYEKHCKITFEDAPDVEPTPKYYHINYRSYPEGTVVETFSPETGKRAIKKIAEVDKLLQNPETQCDTLVLNAEQRLDAGIPFRLNLPQGGYAIYELRIKITTEHPENYAQVMRNVILQGMFDGKQTIRVPVSDFSGGGMGAPYVQSRFLSADGQGSVTSRWLMPYREVGYIALVNEGDLPANAEVSVCLSPKEWDERSLYFHASWKQERGIKLSDNPDDNENNLDRNFATIQGRGVYKGDVLTLFNHSPEWYGEGDEKIWVDDDKFPSHFGTGTNDYYNSSPAPVATFQTPFGGAPGADNPSSYGYNTFFRTRNLDGIPFNKRLKFDLEVLGRKKGTVDYATTIFWYGDIKARAQNLSGMEEATWKLPASSAEPEKPQRRPSEEAITDTEETEKPVEENTEE